MWTKNSPNSIWVTLRVELILDDDQVILLQWSKIDSFQADAEPVLADEVVALFHLGVSSNRLFKCVKLGLDTSSVGVREFGRAEEVVLKGVLSVAVDLDDVSVVCTHFILLSSSRRLRGYGRWG